MASLFVLQVKKGARVGKGAGDFLYKRWGEGWARGGLRGRQGWQQEGRGHDKWGHWVKVGAGGMCGCLARRGSPSARGAP